MEAFLSDLSKRYELQFSSSGEGWKVGLPARSDYICELVVGSDALDWYAIIREAANGKEVFTDWNDYLNYDETPLAELLKKKRLDIEWFVERWTAASSVRVVIRKHLFGLLKKRRAQWQHDGEWYGVILGDPEPSSE